MDKQGQANTSAIRTISQPMGEETQQMLNRLSQFLAGADQHMQQLLALLQDKVGPEFERGLELQLEDRRLQLASEIQWALESAKMQLDPSFNPAQIAHDIATRALSEIQQSVGHTAGQTAQACQRLYQQIRDKSSALGEALQHITRDIILAHSKYAAGVRENLDELLTRTTLVVDEMRLEAATLEAERRE